MKFVVSSGMLLKGLSAVKGIIPNNPVIPILENVLFTIENNVLTLLGSDLQVSNSTSIIVESDCDVRIAVPAKMLLETLRNLNDQPITIKVDTENFSIEILSDNGRYKIAGENPNDYPTTPKVDGDVKIETTTETIKDAIYHTLFAVSSDEMKPSMNGVYVGFTPKYTNFVSTDSHRLVRYRRIDIVSEKESSFIVPTKALEQLKNTLPSNKDIEVTMEFNDINASFSFGSTKIITRLVDERFPDYDGVIPLNNDKELCVERQTLISTLKRIGIFANKSTNQIRFKISGQEIEVSAEDTDFNNEAKESLYCEFDNEEDFEIGFNAKLLMEMLANISSDKVLIKFLEPHRAAIITPEDKEENSEVLMLIMPVMLHSYY